MPRHDRGLRVLILDRAFGNPYSRGLAGGLTHWGCCVTTVAGFDSEADLQVYPSTSTTVPKVRKTGQLLLGLARLTKHLALNRPRVIHAQWPSLLDVIVLRVCQLFAPNATIIFTDHNPFTRDGDSSRSRWATFMVNRADLVAVHGPGLADRFRDANPDNAGKVRVIEHGNYSHVAKKIDRESARRELRIPEESTVYCFIGDLLPRKGLETLMEAFREIADSGTILVLAGRAPDSEYLASLRASGGSKGEIHWLTADAHIPQAELDNVVSASNQVVLPFLGASQSGTVILAMTLGRCVVTTNVGELPRTLASRGMIVEPREPRELAEAMRVAVRDPASCDRLGDEAAAYASSELDWTNVARTVELVYEEGLSLRRRG